MDFGKKVRILRVLRGLSGEDLASRTGLDRTVIVRHEATEDAPSARGPRQKTIEIYSRGLHVPKWILEEESGGEWQDVFRPISPFISTAPEVYSRIAADLRSLLLPFLEHLGIATISKYKCERGGIAIAGGNGRKLVLVLPLNLYRDIVDVIASPALFDEGESGIEEGTIVSFLVDPVGTAASEWTPEELRTGHLPIETYDFYRPPAMVTSVEMELLGDCEDVEERFSKVFPSGEIKKIAVQRPANWRETLLPEVADYLREAGMNISDEGDMLGPENGNYNK